jgi:hypothetical protein
MVQLSRHDSDTAILVDAVVFPEPSWRFPWLQQTNHFGSSQGKPAGGHASFPDGRVEWVGWNEPNTWPDTRTIQETRMPYHSHALCNNNTLYTRGDWRMNMPHTNYYFNWKNVGGGDYAWTATRGKAWFE